MGQRSPTENDDDRRRWQPRQHRYQPYGKGGKDGKGGNGKGGKGWQNPRCNNCGKIGHYANVCWSKPRAQMNPASQEAEVARSPRPSLKAMDPMEALKKGGITFQIFM